MRKLAIIDIEEFVCGPWDGELEVSVIPVEAPTIRIYPFTLRHSMAPNTSHLNITLRDTILGIEYKVHAKIVSASQVDTSGACHIRCEVEGNVIGQRYNTLASLQRNACTHLPDTSMPANNT